LSLIVETLLSSGSAMTVWRNTCVPVPHRPLYRVSALRPADAFRA
jgi:hypothetical protein